MQTMKKIGLLAVFALVAALVAAVPAASFSEGGAGDVLDRRIFGGAGYDYFNSVTAVSDGFVAVGGSEEASFSGTNDFDPGVSPKGFADAIIVKFNNDGVIQWAKNFGGAGHDYFNSVTEVSDGYVAVGYSEETSIPGTDFDPGVSPKGGSDAIIVKFNKDGTIAWAKNFGGADEDYFNSIIAVSDGYIAVGGSEEASFSGTNDFDPGVSPKGEMDAIVVKFNSDGIKQWAKNFGGAGQERFTSIIPVSGGFVATGLAGASSFVGTNDFGSGLSAKGSYDAVAVKFNNDGVKQWAINFGGAGFDFFSLIIPVSDGFVAVGSIGEESIPGTDLDPGSTPKGDSDAVIVKFNNDGIKQWAKNFGGEGNDYLYSVISVSDGYIAVGGSQAASIPGTDFDPGVSSRGNYDAVIVKFNNEGIKQWAKSFGGAGDDYYYSVAAVSGGVVAVGVAAVGSFSGNSDWVNAGISGKGSGDATFVKYSVSVTAENESGGGGGGSAVVIGGIAAVVAVLLGALYFMHSKGMLPTKGSK
ncbi:MAG: hypothetical protein FWC44_00250 [Methanomassiliicoccaceae archaeon]|nr:hypothetical protein [Methanomassiliicoccaceae archaeon]